MKLLQQAESIPPSTLLKLLWFLKKKATLIVTFCSFLKKLGKDLTGRKSFSCSGAALIRSQRCQNDSAVVSWGHSKTPKRGDHAHLTPLNWAHPQLTSLTPPKKDKLEFPAQTQSSETQPKSSCFLRHRLGPSPRGSFGVFSLLPQLVSGCRALAAGADPAGSHAHPSSSPARMTCSAPCSLGFKVCQGALKWLHTGSRTTSVGATQEPPATGPLLPGKFAPAHLSWKDPHPAHQLSVPSCASW